MSTRVRMDPDDRREVILKAAIDLTLADGGTINTWSRNDVARAWVPITSPETVKHYWRMPALRDAVMARLALYGVAE